MKTKHGAYWNSNAHEMVFFWMGEEVETEDFNERLLSQTKSVAKDVDMIQMGVDLKEAIDSGAKTSKDLDALEKVLKLQLCDACRKIIGESP